MQVNVLRGNSYLEVVQKVLKCDVTLLSNYNSDWSQKGKFNSCNIITHHRCSVLGSRCMLYAVFVRVSVPPSSMLCKASGLKL